MSGWRIVPVELPNNFSIGRRREYIIATTGLPEPDWEALAKVAVIAFIDQCEAHRFDADAHTPAMIAALKAAFGSKP